MENDWIKNFTISGKEESLENIISKLKFISKIREGEKVDVKTLTIVDPDIPSRAHRTFISRESRVETYSFIKTVIDRGIGMLYYYLDTKETFHSEMVRLLVVNLKDSKKGITNLTITYEKDRKFVSDIETLMETMDAKIQIKNKLAYDINGSK